MSGLTSPPRIVAISPCMKAQGTLDPTRGHFLPLGQYTSDPAPCILMLFLEHGKQNLCSLIDGHCTKCVSSRRSWQSVHFKVSELCTLVSNNEDGALSLMDIGGPRLATEVPCELPGFVREFRLFGETGPEVMLSVTFIKAAIGEGPFSVAPSGGVGVWLLDGEVDEDPADPYPVEFMVIFSASDWL